MESAGITLVKGDVRGIARAAALSRATMRNIRQNLVFAFPRSSQVVIQPGTLQRCNASAIVLLARVF